MTPAVATLAILALSACNHTPLFGPSHPQKRIPCPEADHWRGEASRAAVARALSGNDAERAAYYQRVTYARDREREAARDCVEADDDRRLRMQLAGSGRDEEEPR